MKEPVLYRGDDFHPVPFSLVPSYILKSLETLPSSGRKAGVDLDFERRYAARILSERGVP